MGVNPKLAKMERLRSTVRGTLVLVQARGRPIVVRRVIVGGHILLVLPVKTKQAELLVHLLLGARPRSPVNTKQSRLWQKDLPFIPVSEKHPIY